MFFKKLNFFGFNNFHPKMTKPPTKETHHFSLLQRAQSYIKQTIETRVKDSVVKDIILNRQQVQTSVEETLHQRTPKDVRYYFQGVLQSQTPDPEISKWCEEFGFESEVLVRCLESIQVLETGRGKVRRAIKTVAKRVGEIGFIDEIKSRGVLQMRSNFVVAKILKQFILSESNAEGQLATELRARLMGRVGLLEYLQMSEGQELEIEQLSDSINEMETTYNLYNHEIFENALKQIIKFNLRYQAIRNSEQWSLIGVARLLSKNPEFAPIFECIDIQTWNELSDNLNVRNSKERIVKIFSFIASIYKFTNEDDSGVGNQESANLVNHYLNLKRELLRIIKPRDKAVSEIKSILDSEPGASVWVAHELLRDSYKILSGMAKQNNERFDIESSWIAMRMFLNSYNRGVSKITLSVIENWVYQLSTLVYQENEIENGLKQTDIDGTFKSISRREELFNRISNSFIKLCFEYQSRGYIGSEYSYSDFISTLELGLQTNLRPRFIGSSLVQELKTAFETHSGSRLQVIMPEEQLQNYFYTYGAKIVRCEADLDSFFG